MRDWVMFVLGMLAAIAVSSGWWMQMPQGCW
jgi:hypothetical protein